MKPKRRTVDIAVVDPAHELEKLFELVKTFRKLAAEAGLEHFHCVSQRLAVNAHCVKIALQSRMPDDPAPVRHELVEERRDEKPGVLAKTFAGFDN